MPEQLSDGFHRRADKDRCQVKAEACDLQVIAHKVHDALLWSNPMVMKYG
jgi:hypothetical protein